jgi:hypothetical protein
MTTEYRQMKKRRYSAFFFEVIPVAVLSPSDSEGKTYYGNQYKTEPSCCSDNISNGNEEHDEKRNQQRITISLKKTDTHRAATASFVEEL